MGFFDGDSWVIPEIFSFVARICEILAMSCILMPESSGGEGRSFSELLFLFSCALVFFLNCFEFIGTPKENLMVQICSVVMGLSGIGILLLNAHPHPLNVNVNNQPLQEQSSYKSAFYASAFSGVSILSCFISGTDFYIHIQN